MTVADAGFVESSEILLWRDAIRSGLMVDDSPALRAAANLLARAGAVVESAMLNDCAMIVQGFSPDVMAEQQRSIGRAQTRTQARWTPGVAVDELRDLAHQFSAYREPTLTPHAAPVYSGYPHNPDGIGPGVPCDPIPGDIAETAARLVAILSDPDPSSAEDQLTDLLHGLAELHRRVPALDYRYYFASSLPILARGIAQKALAGFALATHDLWTAPSGSGRFLHATARLGSATLGPYLRNVGMIVRNSRDIYDLARVAADVVGARGDRAVVGAWVALLARGCDGRLLIEIIDDLGDYDAGAVLSVILARLASGPVTATDVKTISRIRDGAIDTANHGLAARAQTVLAGLAAPDPHALRTLGDIHASGANFAAAEAAYRDALALLPGDRDILMRLTSAKRDSIDGIHTERRDEASIGLADTRLRRRGIRPAYPRRLGTTIPAVDVS